MNNPSDSIFVLALISSPGWKFFYSVIFSEHYGSGLRLSIPLKKRLIILASSLVFISGPTIYFIAKYSWGSMNSYAAKWWGADLFITKVFAGFYYAALIAPSLDRESVNTASGGLDRVPVQRRLRILRH